MEARQYAPLSLAFIGDAVYAVAVREFLLREGDRKVKQFHNDAVAFVRSSAQSRAVRALWDELTEEEQGYVRRGRNTSSAVPKHSTVSDYRYATGFETLLGFLYLEGRQDRLQHLLKRSIEVLREGEEHGTDESSC